MTETPDIGDVLKAMQGPPQIPLVPEGPLPFIVTTTVVQGTRVGEDGESHLENFVKMIVSTPQGVSFLFMEAGQAESIAHSLVKSARSARSGLTVIGNGGE